MLSYFYRMAGENVELSLNVSISQLITELREARAEGERLRADLVNVNKDIKAGFESSSGAAGSMGREISNALKTIDSQTKTIASLTSELENLKKSGSTAFDSTKVDAYQKKIKDLELELQKLRTDTQEATTATVQGATAGGSAMDVLKSKLAAAKEEQRLLKLEVKDFQTAISANDKSIGKISAQLSGLSKSSADYRKTSSDLKAELQSLYQKHETLTAGLAKSQKEYSNTTANVKTYSKELVQAEASGIKFSGGLSKIYGALRTIANIIPGLGIAGIVGLLIEPVILFGKKLYDSITQISEAQRRLNLMRQATTDIQSESIKGYTREVTQLEFLRRIITDAQRPMSDRNDALREYNSVADKANQIDLSQIDNISLINQKIATQIGLIKDRALARAAESIVAQRAEALLLAEEAARQKAIDQQDAELKTGLTVVTNQRNGKPAPDFVIQIEKEADLRRRVEQDAAVKAAKESLDIATETAFKLIDINGFAGKKIKEEKDKNRKADLADERDRADKILALEKQLAEARASLIAESRQKSIAEENARFEGAVKTLELLRNQAEKVAQDIAKKPVLTENDKKVLGQIQTEFGLINKNIEAQQQVHYKKLSDIDTKYYEDAKKAFQAAQDAINGVLLESEDKEVAEVGRRYDAIRKAIEEARKKLLETTKDPLTIGFINANAQNDTAQVTEKEQRDKQDVRNKYADIRLEEEKKLALASIEILRVQGLDEKALTDLKERLKLQAEKTFGERRLEQLKQQYHLEATLTADAIAKITDPKNIVAAQTKGVDIFTFLGINITDEKAKAKILAAIKEIQDAANGIIKKKTGDKTDLFEFLGIDPDTEGKILGYAKAASKIGETVATALDPFIGAIDKQIEAKQRLIDTLQEGIDKQKEAVDKEKELAERGYANNLGIEQKRLADLQKSKDAELAQEKKLAQQRAGLKKAQLIADTVAQTSNLITASTEIFAATAAIPPPAGQILAIAAISAMFAGFVAAKAQAFKAINQEAKSFEKGGSLSLQKALKGAPSHNDGGVDLVERKSGKRIANLEGDEDLFVVNKGSTRKYAGLLEKINSDELSRMSVSELGKLIKPTAMPSFSEGIRSTVNTTKTENRTTVINNQTVNNTIATQHLERLVKTSEQIAESNKQMLAIEKQRPLHIEETEEARTEYYPNGWTRKIVKK